MALPKRYRPADAEPEIQRHWDDCSAYAFDRHSSAPVFSIDTPPPTVSGELHLGHCYSYSHTDFVARYQRMRGANVFYPMGFDDNGLPTERLVERKQGLRAIDVGREAFVERCREVATEAVRDYEALWRRLALSIDWRYTYRTIDDAARATSQRLFLDLYERDLVYRAEGPTIWCPECRTAIAQAELSDLGVVTDQAQSAQSVRVHERCDTPVEYLVTQQWFVRLLDHADELLAAGAQVGWHPPHMRRRYEEWAANLGWDWCISRQRYFGVPFPVWLCDDCGEVVVADSSSLPVDPESDEPPGPCRCGGHNLRPEADVMDTWATSSLTPQIAGRWLEDRELFDLVFPFSMRPQAHEIIRTWAFYTIARSRFHFDALPWTDAMISGWGIAPEGTGKISKSRGGGPMSPGEVFERYSADAVRYWAASSGLGKDAVISEEKVQSGAKLVTKLWNVARLAERFLDGYLPPDEAPALSPADRWILTRTQDVIEQATTAFDEYDYASALHATETFFWRDLADNYLEMAKGRLYAADQPGHDGALYALRAALVATLKLFAPILPHVTDVIYREMFAAAEGESTIHRAAWPASEPRLSDPSSEDLGEALVGIATLVRRHKSENELSLGSELAALRLATGQPGMARAMAEARSDLASVTRARDIEVVDLGPSEDRVAKPWVALGEAAGVIVSVRPTDRP